MKSFSAKVNKIGVNPYMLLPPDVLSYLFKEAGKEKGPIPVRGTLNGKPFRQTLVKYGGKWRFYLNTPMREAAKLDVGDKGTVKIGFDSGDRTVPMNPEFKKALEANMEASRIFKSLPPSRQKEINRYIGFLKSETALTRNIEKAIQFLLGKETFIGRNKI